MLVRSRAQLDGVVNRDAFDYGPDKTRSLYFIFSPEDFAQRPGFSAVHVVKRGNDSCSARLFDVVKRDRVLRTIPPPGFLHLFVFTASAEPHQALRLALPLTEISPKSTSSFFKWS